MLEVTLILVAVELFAEENEPVLLQLPATLLLLEDFTFLMDGVLSLTVVADLLIWLERHSANAVTNVRIICTPITVKAVTQGICLAWGPWACTLAIV